MFDTVEREHCRLAPMRGIKQAVEEIKAADPCTALTERAVRRMVAEGTLPAVRVGRKYLINMDTLYLYLARGSAEAAENETKRHTIRRIAE